MLNSYGSAFVNRRNPSNALSLQLTLLPSQSHPVTLSVVIIDSPSSPSIDSNSQGSNVILLNGNYLIGYKLIPVAREYSPAENCNNSGNSDNTDVRWQARFGGDNLVQVYRMFKQE